MEIIRSQLVKRVSNQKWANNLHKSFSYLEIVLLGALAFSLHPSVPFSQASGNAWLRKKMIKRFCSSFQVVFNRLTVNHSEQFLTQAGMGFHEGHGCRLGASPVVPAQ